MRKTNSTNPNNLTSLMLYLVYNPRLQTKIGTGKGSKNLQYPNDFDRNILFSIFFMIC